LALGSNLVRVTMFFFFLFAYDKLVFKNIHGYIIPGEQPWIEMVTNLLTMFLTRENLLKSLRDVASNTSVL
jgi:hypothetical protein